MTEDTHRQIIRGAVYILTGMLLLSFVDNFFSLAMQDAGFWQFHAMRIIMMAPVFLVIARLTGARMMPRKFAPVLLRSVVFTTSMMVYFSGLGLLPISQVAAGLFTSPIWILVFSVLLYGDKIGVFRIVAMVAGFAGVLIVLRPDPQDLSWLSLMPVASGAFYGLAMLLTRKHCAQEDAFCLTVAGFCSLGLCGIVGLLWFTFVPTAPSKPEAAFLVQGWVAPTLIFWGVLLLQVFGSIGAVNLINRAYISADASYIAVFEYSFLGFAVGWAWLLWGSTIDLTTAIGLAIIVISGTVIAMRSKAAETLPDQLRSEG